MSKYSRKLKKIIAKRYLDDESSRQLGREYNISSRQIRYWGAVYSFNSEQSFLPPASPYSAKDKLKVLTKMQTEDWSLGHTSAFFNLSSPGTVGACPIQNIGAYGVEVGNTIEEVRGLQLSSEQWMSFTAAQCDFSYRDSIFKKQFKNDFLITQVIFKLLKVFKPQVSYAPLNTMAEQFLAVHDQDPLDQKSLTAKQVAGWVIEVRNSKLPDPNKTPNAGSFFTNPIIPKSQADELLSQFPNIPVYAVQNNAENKEVLVKVAAGWLIDQCGWKGKSLGLAKMHDQQALVLTLKTGASQQDLINIQQAVQADVKNKFGIQLHPEPQPFN